VPRVLGPVESRRTRSTLPPVRSALLRLAIIRLTITGVFVALLAVTPAADLLAANGQRGRGAGGVGAGTDPPSRYVIVGHVGDQAKRPVAGAFVTALLPSHAPNQPFTLVSARLQATTDAHGNFRLEGLYPADFY